MQSDGSLLPTELSLCGLVSLRNCGGHSSGTDLQSAPRSSFGARKKRHPLRKEELFVCERVAFCCEVGLLEFAGEIHREFKQIHRLWGPSEYKKWRLPFPREAHERLRKAIAAYKQSP